MYTQIEQMVNLDFNRRSIDKLYVAARHRTTKPIIEEIAERILQIPSDSYVFLSTGSVTRSWVDPSIGETDGPLGTVVLAKRIRELTSAIPVIITENSLLPSVKTVVSAAGLSVVTPEQAQEAQNKKSRGQISIACLLPFTEDSKEAPNHARKLIERMNPSMVFCIEKAGFNEAGIYHNMRGHDYSQGRARIDYLIKEAHRKQIITVGIGDGGNEIGMGAIIDTVRKHVRYGEKCQCGCGKGIAAMTPTDILLTGSVSNWACYAICAALALKTKKTSMLHKSQDEKRLIEAAISSGMIDGATGKAELTVDGFSIEANCSIVEFIHSLVMKEIFH